MRTAALPFFLDVSLWILQKKLCISIHLSSSQNHLTLVGNLWTMLNSPLITLNNPSFLWSLRYPQSRKDMINISLDIMEWKLWFLLFFKTLYKNIFDKLHKGKEYIEKYLKYCYVRYIHDSRHSNYFVFFLISLFFLVLLFYKISIRCTKLRGRQVAWHGKDELNYFKKLLMGDGW